MSKSEKKVAAGVVSGAPDNKRRNFLIGAGLGSAAAAAAVVGGKAAVKTPAAVEPGAESQDSGYRETEHVRRYYGTTRI